RAWRAHLQPPGRTDGRSLKWARQPKRRATGGGYALRLKIGLAPANPWLCSVLKRTEICQPDINVYPAMLTGQMKVRIHDKEMPEGFYARRVDGCGDDHRHSGGDRHSAGLLLHSHQL